MKESPGDNELSHAEREMYHGPTVRRDTVIGTMLTSKMKRF